ncbi:dienelactone hydrolase family protein [Paraburkholderia caribensis]|jgi:dienelactone hydrolase|uniref:dienelactone hydrolase family protein n=1 Tax=Paraburkholderia caribensis TaxID=75105 RepID=UPI000720AB4B|nr:alpha/beta family hydrolase [Paraburkholderia caribensis]ALP66057.1 hydrolase [Paraburkholderia caribensis]AMV45949.1 hydrolase [Paraburkholderia caribensis]AUT55012.1 alpha/beta hydrolase [Paraburkholderia caribensis]CAG9237722.1 Hydrolase [Paraburkholderia caribensis]
MQTLQVEIPVDYVKLGGILEIPDDSRAVVVFVHGSGSSRFSPRNRQVAAGLQHAGFATLLFDLLTLEEQRHDDVDATYRFNIPLLARRLSATLGWLRQRPDTATLRVGLFGASTGAAAALVAAAEVSSVDAIVSRGGRPDLARAALPSVSAPTLLIVGGLDTEVIRLNDRAAGQLTCGHRVEIVPGATHLFEEPGALDEVTRLAAGWFARWLIAPLT